MLASADGTENGDNDSAGGGGSSSGDNTTGAATDPGGATATTAAGSGGSGGAGGSGGGGETGAAGGPSPCSAPSDAPGVTDDEITLGTISSLSGPVPGLGASALAAAQAYVAYRNSTGGVCGRQLVLRTADDGTDNGRHRAARHRAGAAGARPRRRRRRRRRRQRRRRRAARACPVVGHRHLGRRSRTRRPSSTSTRRSPTCNAVDREVPLPRTSRACARRRSSTSAVDQTRSEIAGKQQASDGGGRHPGRARAGAARSAR